MKALKKLMPVAVAALFAATGAQATTIDFTGLSTTSDPVVGSVSFWAGDPALIHETYVYDDGVNEYLLSGFLDGSHAGGPASGYDTFIGVSKTGAAFGSVSFAIASEYNFPAVGGGNTTLWVEAYLGGALVGSASQAVSTTDFVTLSLNIAGGFDSLRIYDDLNAFDLGETFHIDNFEYAEYQAPCTGPGCNPNPVPEPAAMLLLGIGMAGLAFSRRRKSA